MVIVLTGQWPLLQTVKHFFLNWLGTGCDVMLPWRTKTEEIDDISAVDILIDIERFGKELDT